jgi:hypothetical protein
MAGPITMKGAVTFAGPNVKIVDAVVPQPQPGQVVIKVAYRSGGTMELTSKKPSTRVWS